MDFGSSIPPIVLFFNQIKVTGEPRSVSKWKWNPSYKSHRFSKQYARTYRHQSIKYAKLKRGRLIECRSPFAQIDEHVDSIQMVAPFFSIFSNLKTEILELSDTKYGLSSIIDHEIYNSRHYTFLYFYHSKATNLVTHGNWANETLCFSKNLASISIVHFGFVESFNCYCTILPVALQKTIQNSWKEKSALIPF